MRLTRLTRTVQNVRLYVLAEHRVRSTGKVGHKALDLTYAFYPWTLVTDRNVEG